MSRAARRRAARRGGAAGASSFVAAVGAVAAALRVGAGPEAAWRRVGVGTDDGVPRAQDLAGLGGAGPRQVAAVVAAARLSAHVGTPAAELLERATVAVTRDVEAEARRRTALAGPRATANLLALLPCAGLLLGVVVGARPWEQLLGGGAGSVSALVGIALLVAGRRWTAREIRAAEVAGDRAVEDGPAGPGDAGRRPRQERRVDVLPGRRGWPRTGRRWGAQVWPPRADPGVAGAVLAAPPRRGGSPDAAGARVHAGWRRRPHRVGGGRRIAALGVERPAPNRSPASSRAPSRARVGAGTADTRRPGVGELVPRRDRRARPAGDDAAVLLDLVDGACQAGVGVPQALDAVGAAVGGGSGEDLRRAARRLTLGAPWPAAWHGCGPEVRPVARALRPAWEDGVPPGSLLRSAAESVRRARDAGAAEAAARLGVRLVVPLGLCHLPAFVLIGLVPVLGSMATTTLGG